MEYKRQWRGKRKVGGWWEIAGIETEGSHPYCLGGRIQTMAEFYLETFPAQYNEVFLTTTLLANR